MPHPYSDRNCGLHHPLPVRRRESASGLSKIRNCDLLICLYECSRRCVHGKNQIGASCNCRHILDSDLSPLTVAMAQQPMLLPDPFDGEKTSWPEWETHFKHVAAIKKWESADEKLKWLRVRLTGKAQAAFSRCSEAVRNDYGECMKALAKGFNPDSKREVYVAVLHSRNRRKEEDWATYPDILKGLADKAYPDLEKAVRERLALNQFLGELDRLHLKFGRDAQKAWTRQFP